MMSCAGWLVIFKTASSLPIDNRFGYLLPRFGYPLGYVGITDCGEKISEDNPKVKESKGYDWLCYNHLKISLRETKKPSLGCLGLSACGSRWGWRKTQNLCNTRPRKSIPADVPKGGATASCTPSCSSLPPIPNSQVGRCSSSRPLLPSTTCSLGMSSAALSGICITCKFRPALPIAESGASSNARGCSQRRTNAPNSAKRISGGVSVVSGCSRATRGNSRKINVFRDLFRNFVI